ncbi:MAG: DMT family transporter [Deltaproteobacteria bacterium]|nr:DMT family transporter [Deltaproteobacteria bacterium]
MQTGVIYAVIAGLFWGTSPVLVKRGLVNSNVSAATLVQQATILVTLIVASLIEGDFFAKNVPTQALLIFAGTGVIGAYLGRTLFVKSVDQIGASRAQSLNNSSPLITVMLAAAVLHERLSWAVLVGVVLIVSGVFFVTDPEAKENGRAQRKLTATSVLATLCYGVVPVLKKFGTDYGGPPVLGALIMHATGLVLLLTLGSLLKIELKRQTIPTQSLLCFISAGVLYAIGSTFTFRALIHAPASIAAPIWSAQPIVSFFLVKLFLRGIEKVTFWDGIAAGLVVAGVLVLRMI